MDTFVRCPRCWKHTPAGAQFCPRCGSSLVAVTRTVAAPQQPRPGSGGGLTALLLFLVMGAFGLMIMLFVATTTHAPVVVPPAPVQMQPSVPSDGQISDDGQPPGYVRRWDDNGHARVAPPQPSPYFYQVRPHVAYPPVPNPPPRDDDRDSNR